MIYIAFNPESTPTSTGPRSAVSLIVPLGDSAGCHSSVPATVAHRACISIICGIPAQPSQPKLSGVAGRPRAFGAAHLVERDEDKHHEYR
jgi:hypothetical protein